MPGNRSRARSLLSVGAPLIVAGALGFLLTTSFRLSSGSESVDAIPSLSNGVVYAAENDDGTLTPVLGQGIRVPDPRQPARFLVWNQPTYSGDLTEDACRRLIKLGKAVALEHRLAGQAKSRFREAISDAEQELRAISKLYDSELERVKAALRDRPDRHIVVRAKARDSDPRWPEVTKLCQELDGSRAGTVVGESLDGKGGSVIYFAMHWTEWPLLKRLHDRRHAAAVSRRDQAGTWVENEFDKHGMALFRP